MEKCKSQFIDFVLDRIDEGRRKLWSTEEYKELLDKRQEAELNLFGDNQELKAKFNAVENLGSQAELLQDVNTYMQGVKDARILMELFGL